MSQPAQANEDVTIGITGFNPYRVSQFENLDLWLKAGMSEAAAGRLVGAEGDQRHFRAVVRKKPGGGSGEGEAADEVGAALPGRAASRSGDHVRKAAREGHRTRDEARLEPLLRPRR